MDQSEWSRTFCPSCPHQNHQNLQHLSFLSQLSWVKKKHQVPATVAKRLGGGRRRKSDAMLMRHGALKDLRNRRHFLFPRSRRGSACSPVRAAGRPARRQPADSGPSAERSSPRSPAPWSQTLCSETKRPRPRSSAPQHEPGSRSPPPRLLPPLRRSALRRPEAEGRGSQPKPEALLFFSASSLQPDGPGVCAHCQGPEQQTTSAQLNHKKIIWI